MSDIDDLVAALPTAQHGSGCWASKLDDQPATFIAGVKAREENGEKLLRGAIRDILKREWDVTIGDEALRNHLLGRCRCE